MCGIPDELYVDHGSDFISHQLRTTAVDLRIRLIHSTVARPQGRGKIERFFGSVNTELLPELPGHLAPGQRTPEPGLTLPQLSDRIGAFIIGTYHQRTHPEIGTSPQQAWLAGAWLPRLPDSQEALDELLLTVAKSRVVHRDGIHFQGLRYISPTLASYVTEPVAIRYDPRDITEIRVFHRNTFLCRAIAADHQGETITLKDIQAARNARRRALRTELNERIAVVAEHLPAHAPKRPAGADPVIRRPSRPKLRTYLEDK
jgi:putative transposase